jgi:hypothetical protein
MDLRTALEELRKQVESIKTEEDAEYFFRAVSALRDVADARRKQFVQERMSRESAKRSTEAFDKAFGAMNEFVVKSG